MKRHIWIWFGVFLLGFLIGVKAGTGQPSADTQLPVFLPATPPTVGDSILSTLPPTQGATAPTDPTQAHPLKYTSLVAHGLAAYDGPCLEDGTSEELTDVAALILENTGTIGIHYAQIIVTQGGTELSFDATYIPPRGTVLIVESNRAPYSDSQIDSYRCSTVIPGSFDWEEDQVSIEPEGICSMRITNLTDRALKNIRIYYKQHQRQQDLYIGGITFSAVIASLEPGETRTLTPYGYATGYAQVVAVELDPI